VFDDSLVFSLAGVGEKVTASVGAYSFPSISARLLNYGLWHPLDEIRHVKAVSCRH
jgi:hypothetical protein